MKTNEHKNQLNYPKVSLQVNKTVLFFLTQEGLMFVPSVHHKEAIWMHPGFFILKNLVHCMKKNNHQSGEIRCFNILTQQCL